MSSVLTNLSIIQKLAKDLVQARQLNYSQQCIPYYVDQSKFVIENMDDLRNISGHLLKSSLIRHRLPQQQHKAKNSRGSAKPNTPTPSQYLDSNSKCVVFLHGLGSSRLEALPLVQCLPPQYCLFAFDFAGSGKSEGENITYGLRESEDISTILDYLRTNKGIKQFVIWGRSMGAVASLIFSINLTQSSKDSQSSKCQLNRIKGLVIDSPFSDFREITKHIALKRVNLPEFLIDFALSIIQNSFNQLLKDQKRDNTVYNPFKIQLGSQPIQTKIPTIFLYSLIDQVVPKEHSQKIIKSYKSIFDKFVMEDCSHNQARPRQIIQKVFQSLKKLQVKASRINGPDPEDRGLRRNYSMDISERRGSRRGISVESKEKQKSFIVPESIIVSTEQSQNYTKHSNITINTYNTFKVEPKKSKISCKMNKNVYISDSSPTNQEESGKNSQSPLKIRLSNSLNRSESNKISVQATKTYETINQSDISSKLSHAHMNFYSTIEYDNSILQKKLMKNNGATPNNRGSIGNVAEEHRQSKLIEHKNAMKYRRSTQINRKVEYQLNHTRYL